MAKTKVENRTEAALAIAGVVLKPGANELTDAQQKALESHPQAVRLMEDGKLSGVPCQAPVAEIIAQMGECDRAIDLTRFNDERPAVQVAKAKIKKILETQVPYIQSITSRDELLRQYLDRPTDRAWVGDKANKGGRHPAVLRAIIKKARELGVKLPAPNEASLLPVDVRAS